MENLSWENADLGISFSVAYGRITVFKTTLKAIGLPPYYRFLLDSENGKLAVEKCSFNSSGAHQLPEDTSHDSYELKSMDMVRFIYQTCGWEKNSTYRIQGIAVPERNMVVFDLTMAYRVTKSQSNKTEFIHNQRKA